MDAVNQLSREVGIETACAALGVNRARFYRVRARKKHQVTLKARHCPLALSPEEEELILDTFNSPRFMDQSPYQVYATLLDEGRYLGSIRTFYRVLGRHDELRERRDQLRHPNYTKPELLATGPNQVWSWDITKLKGPSTWTYFHLYVILDIFSRYVVGWMVAHRESSELAQRLISETCDRQGIHSGQLTIHADRGSSMTSKGVEQLLVDLGVTKTHSRPHISDDNPYSEAQFKTLKYRPEFPERFGAIEDSRAHCGIFFDWYNHEHYHSGIALLTPDSVHSGRATEIIAQRNLVLAEAFAQHPERFKGKMPVAPQLPKAAWINPPKKNQESLSTD